MVTLQPRSEIYVSENSSKFWTTSFPLPEPRYDRMWVSASVFSSCRAPGALVSTAFGARPSPATYDGRTMTHSHAVEGTSLAERLRERGMRMTPQRQRVMDAVIQLVHATPDQVAEAVPAVDLTTVYRTLETLEQIGMLAHTHLGHGAPSYRLADDDHVHVVCHHCSRVVDAPAGLADELASRLNIERGFMLDRSHFTVFGTCSDCRTAGLDA